MSKHLKRLATPRKWPLARKTEPWAIKPSAGPHGQEEAVPLTVVLRDMLEVCDTAGEAEQIVGDRKILIDGTVATDPKRPVGLMDVLTLDPEDRHYRVLEDRRGVIRLVEIDADRAGWKLCRIEDKTIVSDGKIQLNLHDGRNIVLKEEDHATGDVLRVGIPDQEVLDSYALEEGHVAFIVGGTHAGEIATVSGIQVTKGPQPNLVSLESEEGIETIKPYVFIVGTDTPEIELPEVSIVE